MTTMMQIAKCAGVSPGVVSRIINGDTTLRVSKETRQRVETAIRDANYSPNVMAQLLASSKAGIIAFVVHDVANPVYGGILKGAHEEATRQDKALLVGDAAAGKASNTRLAQMVAAGGVEGLILQPAGEQSDELIANAARKGVPIVLLQAGMDIDAHLVQFPDEQATIIATRHLRSLGHEKIGCLATEQGLTFTQARLAGWRKTMGKHANDKKVVFAPPNSDGGVRAMRDLLERYPDMTGLVCFNVVAAVGAVRELGKRGIRVPEDLSIIAIHEVKFIQDLRVPLTVVEMPVLDMGREAVKSVCTPPLEPRSHIILESPPVLIKRDSTAPPR